MKRRPDWALFLFKPSLRANGSRECAPDDRLREAIQLLCSDKEKRKLDCFVAALLGRNWRLVRRPPQSKLSSPRLTGRSSTPRLLVYLKRLWNTGSPGQAGR